MDDAAFLRWIHDRLEEVYGENPSYDFMTRLRQLSDRMEQYEDLVMAAQKVLAMAIPTSGPYSRVDKGDLQVLEENLPCK